MFARGRGDRKFSPSKEAFDRASEFAHQPEPFRLSRRMAESIGVDLHPDICNIPITASAAFDLDDDPSSTIRIEKIRGDDYRRVPAIPIFLLVAPPGRH